jgi:hypothetical protein
MLLAFFGDHLDRFQILSQPWIERQAALLPVETGKSSRVDSMWTFAMRLSFSHLIGRQDLS